jgi:hypothetical protein
MLDLKKPDQRRRLMPIANARPSVTGRITAATVQISVLRSDRRKCGSRNSARKFPKPMKTGSVMPS